MGFRLGGRSSPYIRTLAQALLLSCGHGRTARHSLAGIRADGGRGGVIAGTPCLGFGEELETVLISRFKFPVEVIVLKRFKNQNGKILYDFEPFLNELGEDTEKIGISDIDTIVIPAREDGFKDVFINENCWYAIRLNSSMIPKIKYIAAYQVAPVSAITYIAEIKSIEQWKDINKYILHFVKPARKIKKVPLGKSKGKAPQSPRYSSKERILDSENLDNVF